MPPWLTYTLLGSLVLIFCLMPFHAFISTWGGAAVGPLWLWKSWKELLLAALIIPVVGWLLFRPAVLKQLLGDKLVVVVLAYVTLSLLLALIWLPQNGKDAVAAGIGMNLRYLLAATYAYLLFRFSSVGTWPWQKWAAGFIVAVGITVSLMGLVQVQWLSPTFLEQFGYSDATIAPAVLIDENPDAPRAFATLRGPNDYGAFLILPLLISLLLTRRSAWWWVAVIAISAGIFESSSRSAWMGAGVATLVLGWLVVGRKYLYGKRLAYALSGLVVAGVLSLVAAITIPSVRLEVFHSSPGDPSIFEGSTAKHFEQTGEGIMRVVQQPLGCGVGCAGPASYYGDDARISENYYVQIAEEVGVIGLGLWLYIAGIVGVRLYRLRKNRLAGALCASFLGIAVIGLWLHVWADDPLSLTWWILAGAILGIASDKTRKTL